MNLNIIHLNESLFPENSNQYAEAIRRRVSVIEQTNQQNIQYTFINAIYDKDVPFRGCAQSHKLIVKIAKLLGLKMVAIAEDDIRFFAPGAYDFFIKNIPESFDLWLGMSYSLIEYPDGLVKDYFDSLSLYVINERFYDEFLALEETNHIDRQLSFIAHKKEFKVCTPYVCEQLDGYSFLAGYSRTYGHRLEGKQKFGISS